MCGVRPIDVTKNAPRAPLRFKKTGQTDRQMDGRKNNYTTLTARARRGQRNEHVYLPNGSKNRQYVKQTDKQRQTKSNTI